MFASNLISLEETFSLLDGFPNAPFVKKLFLIDSDFVTGSLSSITQGISNFARDCDPTFQYAESSVVSAGITTKLIKAAI